MAYVVTQSCCADASCVVACPVNCIHPAPGEPGFAEAEMVHIDANSCVGCGACVTACPVGAIVPDRLLSESQKPFLDINADYYDVFPHADRTPLALVPEQRRLQRPGPFRVAVVGSGPAGLYTADELLKHPEVTAVDVHDRLGTPYGLVRFGVAPDHVATKQVTDLFAAIESDPRFGYRLGVRVGVDVTLAQLREEYDAVVYAVGASSDRSLGIPGEELPGAVAATDLVGWYNGHPDQRALDVPLAHERAVVIGNGNVALDVARILTGDPDALAPTSIDRDALAALRGSEVREVVVLGRRGPAEAAFTVPELVGLAALTDVDVVVDCDPALLAGESRKVQLLRDIADRPVDPTAGRRRIVLRFAASPVAVTGTDRVTGVRVVRNRLVTGEDGRVRPEPTEDYDDLPAGLVVRSIGFKGRPVTDLPFDDATGTVPHQQGRVAPGVYVAGWIKRGPSGFIGTNKTCAQETVASILDDFDSGAAGRTAQDAERVGANSAAMPVESA
ncbi:FAD-dependent oxidoreductase [Nocardioides panacisoli]|uniref:FAD-dependent oxidoreductase n=1 Tax=Nocardioides panacisoli TaxID=627624 RepID=UPI001C636972|nr:FAD-dependent oxidoreductase [Nocardioides panacisoli]QYJ03372.1 FAD-dependent oxidoreductase [Nocardioides panacisoli]